MGIQKYKFIGLLILLSLVFNAFAQKKNVENDAQLKIISVAKDNYQKGNYGESLKGAFNVYDFARRHGDPALSANAGNVIGLVYLAQGRAKTALEFFKNASEVNTNLNNQQRLAANLINVSLAYSDLKILDSAIYYVQRSLAISKSLDIKNLLAMGQNHLGDFYRMQGRLEAAEQQFRLVLDNKSFQSDWENSFAYTGLARIYYADRRHAQAAAYADRAFQAALKTKTKWDAVQALEIGHQAYKAMGDTKNAYDRLLNYKNYSDSIFSSEKLNLANELILKEKSRLNDNLTNDIRIADQQRKIDRLIIGIVLVIVILLIFISIYIYHRYIKSDRANRSLQAIHETALYQKDMVEQQNEDLNRINRHKDLLFSILGHDLRSPFAMIESTLEVFRSGELDQEELISLAKDVADQTHSASVMLDKLLLWAGSQLGGMSYLPVPINLVEKIEKILSVLAPLASRKQITIEHEQIVLPLVYGDADQVRIMLQNLIANAIKFTRKKGLIRIDYVVESTFIELAIHDNGIGMEPVAFNELLIGTKEPSSTYGTSNEKGIGLGMQLVRGFANQNRIMLTGSSAPGKGTIFRLRFDIAGK